MEEKYFVEIKDDFGKVRTFEVPTLEMKEKIDSIDEQIKEELKEDALKNAIPFSAFPNEDFISYKAQNINTNDDFFEVERYHRNKALWQVVKQMKNQKYKKVLYMYYKNGIKFNKIAKYLNCSKQSISDNHSTAIDDLRVMVMNNKKFQNTYYFKQYQLFLNNRTMLTAREKVNKFIETKDFSQITTIDNMLEFSDMLQTIMKKEKKTGIDKTPEKTLKEQKFELFGQTFSFMDIINIGNEFLEPYRKKS